MTVPCTSEELLLVIRKSAMVSEQKLAAALGGKRYARGLPGDPRELAENLIQDGVLTCFQAEQFLLGKWRGFTIGKFKLLERIGIGGMGQVFLCEHLFMNRRVAVKILPPGKADQPAALGRFYREARAAGSLSHNNIIRTHDIDQDGNLHYIVMDYVHGPNLLDVVKTIGPMDFHRAASYIYQVALGLEYSALNNIVHRDIKPGNILLDRMGVARILDMGLARFLNDHTDQLTIKYDDKIVLGTADYVAPEQVVNSHAVDIRADIYALGGTFYYLLAGHPPFPTGSVAQKLLWHRTKDPTPIRQIRPEIPDRMARIVERMLAKDPRQRYQRPALIAEELEQFLDAPVTLPSAEEMPLLSPAVMEMLHQENDGVAQGEAYTIEAIPRGLTAAEKCAPAPFAQLAASPWPASSAAVLPTSPLQTAPVATHKRPHGKALARSVHHANETASGMEYSPDTKPDMPAVRVRRSRFGFLQQRKAATGDMCTRSAPPWGMIIWGMISALVLGVLLAYIGK